ncbi:MAG: hypothetical protein ACTSQ5_14470 [Promethearchaeota archaeon]
MTTFPDDKKNKKKDEISNLENQLMEDSKILEERFNSIKLKTDGEESPKTTRTQENWENFIKNTQSMLKKWESDWKELNQKKIEKRRERKRKIILGERINNGIINIFFSDQKKAFNKKLEELEAGISDDQPLTPKEIRQHRRVKRWKKRQELRDQRKEILKEHRLEKLDSSEERQANRREFLEKKKNIQKDYYKEQQANRQIVAKEKKEQRAELIQKRRETTKEITSEKQQVRKDNWNRFLRLQRRKRQRFMKFQNRLWWKGYFTFLLEILLLVGFILFILWIFNLVGVNIIELIQNLFPSEV